MESTILAIMICVISVIIINFFQIIFTKDDLIHIKSTQLKKCTIPPYIHIPATCTKKNKGLTPEVDNNCLLIEAAMNLILEHYSDPYFNTEKLARILNTSSRSLQRKFKLICQSSPSREIKKYRLKRSITGLNTNHKIKKVVYESGFSSASYFCKCFKEHYGCTPSEYLLNRSDFPRHNSVVNLGK